jgi:hypothetical protein
VKDILQERWKFYKPLLQFPGLSMARSKSPSSSPNRFLQDAAKKLEMAAAKGKAIAPLLKRLCPHIVRQIIRDGKTPGLLPFWGRSVNVDENVGQTIVHPAILRAIGAWAGVPMRGRVVHAGLQHTYGYLFSLLDTPYGAKRDRWVSDAWERAFRLEPSLLGAQPKAGTLLANVTWFLGQIVYRDQPHLRQRLERISEAVAPEIKRYDCSQLLVKRLVEQIIPSRKIRRQVQIITDLVSYPFPPADPGAENTLLIYSIQNGLRASRRLITVFPIQGQAAKNLLESASPETNVPILLRYNAYVPGLYGLTVKGRRFLAN